MKCPRSGEAGQVLVMALILLTLGAAIVVPTMNLAFTSIKYHELSEGKALETLSADSGVQLGLARLRNDPEGYKVTPLEEGFTLNGTTVNVTVESVGGIVHKITSTATSDSGRSTTIVCYTSTTSGLLENVVVSNGDMQLQESFIYAVAGDADLFVNGDLQLQDSSINGTVTYTGDLTMSNSVVTGGLTQGGEPEEMPPIDVQYWEDAAKSGDTFPNDKLIKNRTDYVLGPAFIGGDLTIQNSSVILNGTVYVVGQIQMQDDSTVTGSSVMVAEGLIQLQSASYDTDNIPIIMSANSTIQVQAGSQIAGVLYAPNGQIIIQDFSVLYGSAIGSYVQIQKSTLIYTADVESAEGVPGSQVGIFTYSY